MAKEDTTNDTTPAAAGAESDSPIINNNNATNAPTDGLDDFTMDIEKVTDGFSPGDGKLNAEGGDGGDVVDASNADDAGAAVAGGDDGNGGGDDDDAVAASSSGNGDVSASKSTANDGKKSSDNSDGGAGSDGKEEKMDTSSNNDADASDAAEGRTANDDESGGATDDANEETEAASGEEEDELWDLKMILKPSQISQANPIMCSNSACGLVACCIWQSNLTPDEPWYSCLDCQFNDFGGWPEKEETGEPDLPVKVLGKELRTVMLEKCTRNTDRRLSEMPDLPSGESDDDDEDAEDGSGGTTEEDATSTDEAEAASGSDDDWELNKVFTVKELKKSKPVKCDHEDCELVACSKWRSMGPLKEVWNSCLDCQQEDYDGWPSAESGELPIKFMTIEHRAIIAEKCSNESDPEMPSLPTSAPSLLVTAGAANKKGASAITPPPSHNQAVVDNQSNVVVGASRGGKGGGKKKAPTVTPKNASKKKSAGNKAEASTAAAAAAKKPAAKPPVQSAKTVEMHRRWQEEATKQGGPDNKIIVSKADAKKVIFDKLHDSFRPMNITGLFNGCKAQIPSVVLKGALDEMVGRDLSNPFADDSDDDDDEPKKKKGGGAKKSDTSDPYAGSVRLKEGRNANNTLYYIDHTKLSNNGNGLLPEARNELLNKLATTKAELDLLSQNLKKINAEAAQLESEPKNEALLLEVTQLEKTMTEMNDSLEEARAYAGNEKRVKALKKEIDNNASVWRKRRRQCMEFISMMEESTEGTITVKKCLKGDGPIDIDSDEAAIEGAIAFASRKRPRVSMKGKGGLKGSDEGGMKPDPKFVGVKLTAQGKPERVFVDE